MTDMDSTDGPIAIYDRDGNRISMRQWNRLLGDRQYKVVEQTKVNNLTVSTVWLGLDHNWYNNGGAPLIFETMIFADKEEEEGRLIFEEYQMRYSTEVEALAGHVVAVEWVKAREEVKSERNDHGDARTEER